MDMAEGQFQHFILTRFNVRISRHDAGTMPSRSWLERRFDLFETYCLPSLTGQTNQNFSWFLFFDIDTPDLFRERIKAYEQYGTIEVVYVDLFSLETIIPAIQPFILDSTEYLVTTRLDNDDCLSFHFVQEVQDRSRWQVPGFLNFPDGFVLKDGKIYRHHDRSNSFLTYIEKIDARDGLKTVCHVQHRDALNTGMVCQIPETRCWIQVVHGSNVSNRIKNRRVNRRLIGSSFPILPLDENPVGIALENLVVHPLRMLREYAIVALKKVIYALGMQDLKDRYLNSRKGIR